MRNRVGVTANRHFGWKMVLPERIELSTSPLPRPV
jgi:hypothetical protein